MDWSSRTSPAGEAHIRGDHGAEGKLHHVAWDQFGRGYRLPGAVAADGCIQRQPRFQRGKGRLGAALLEQSEGGIEDQKAGDDRGLDIFAERQFEHDRRLEHPRNRRPEFFERHAQRMERRIRHRVGAELRQPTACFVACQAARKIILCDRCRFGEPGPCIGRRSSRDHVLSYARQPTLANLVAGA